MITTFRWGLLEKIGVRFFQMQFLHKNQLKPGIFSERKKFINKNVFLCQIRLRI